MNIDTWKQLCIAHFRGGIATDEQWDEMANVMLCASENGDLDLATGLDRAIDPSFDETEESTST